MTRRRVVSGRSAAGLRQISRVSRSAREGEAEGGSVVMAASFGVRRSWGGLATLYRPSGAATKGNPETWHCWLRKPREDEVGLQDVVLQQPPLLLQPIL